MTFQSVTEDQIEALAFAASLEGRDVHIERNPRTGVLHLTLDGVAYSARGVAA